MNTQENQAEMNERLVQRAKEILMESGNCAQTSFAVLQEEFNLDGGEVLRALTPFPGIALRGETCGAVVGSLMALGLVFGRDDLKDWRGYIASLRPSRKFCARFEEEHGSTLCANILEVKLGRSYDLADRVQALEYASAGGAAACGEVVAKAVEIAAEVIKQKR